MLGTRSADQCCLAKLKPAAYQLLIWLLQHPRVMVVSIGSVRKTSSCSAAWAPLPNAKGGCVASQTLGFRVELKD